MECEFCGYEFPDSCGRYGCPNCEGDGLADPEAYLARLADKCRPGTPIWVEKILEGHERLPEWAAAGTTGYDALREIGGVLVDPSGASVALPGDPLGLAAAVIIREASF